MKKLISIILVIIMMMTSMSAIFSMPASADEPAAEEKDWTGWTPISNATEFAAIRSGTASAPNKYYLTANFVWDKNPIGWGNPSTMINNVEIDGNGKTITISMPLFDSLNNVRIENLNLDGSVELSASAWALKSPITAGMQSNGVITLIGVACDVDINISNTAESKRFGGVVNKAKEGSYFENVSYTGNLTVSGTRVHHFGGIVGLVWANNDASAARQTTTFKNCVNTADIYLRDGILPHTLSGTQVIGGIAGIAGSVQGTAVFDGCQNTGDIKVDAKGALWGTALYRNYSVSGIMGNFDGIKNTAGSWILPNITITNCSNSGDLTVKNCTNGLWINYSTNYVTSQSGNSNTGTMFMTEDVDAKYMNHTYVADSTEKEATFHEDGYTGKAHYKCSVCGAHFANNGDKYSTTDPTIVIPALKKSYTEITNAAQFAAITSGTVDSPKKYYISKSFEWNQNAIGYGNPGGIIENVEIYGEGNTITITKPLFNALNNVTIDSLNIAGSIDAHRQAWSEKSPLTANSAKENGVVTLKNITSSVNVNVTNTDGSARIAGVIAKVKEGSYFENVTFDGTLTFASTATMIHHFGGIVALVSVNTDASAARQTTTFKDCVNNANIVIPEGFVTHALSGTLVTGGISGICGHIQGNAEFDGCVNNGNITINAKGQLWGTSLYRHYLAAGISAYIDGVKNTAGGWILPNVTIKNCTNNGDISAKSCTNGLWTNYHTSSVKTQSGNTNTGVITLTEDLDAKYLYHTYEEEGGVAASCTEAGVKTYYSCTACNNIFDTNTSAYPTTADMTIPAHHDVMTLHEAKAADCQNEGWVDYYFCDECDTYFDAEKNATTRDEIFSAAGHDGLELIPAKASTCAYTGFEAHFYCSACQNYLDADRNITTKDALVIAKLAHNYGELTSVEATCSKNGLKAHYHCSDCGKYFDENKNPTTKASLTTTKGHTLGTLVAEKACTHTKTTLKNGMQAHYVCEDCGDYFTVGGIRVTKEALTIYASHIYYIDKCDDENTWKECSCGLKDADSITPIAVSGTVVTDAAPAEDVKAPVEAPIVDAPVASLENDAKADDAKADDAKADDAKADDAKADDTKTDGATDGGADDTAKKGCKSAIGATLVVMSATLALGATTLIKKKED